jgi:hypothetical protein
VTLTDFGIAQAAGVLHGTDPFVGSPGYICPERRDGAPAAPAADQWAVGATLYFAFVGHDLPHDRTEPPPVRTRGPLGSVITGLLQPDPQARLSGMQAAALLASPGAAPDDPARRPWARAGVALAVGLLLGIVIGLLVGPVLLPGIG